MSYFIANSIKYNTKLDAIEVQGGDNNVVPRYNSWTHYEKKEYLLSDLISGSIDLRANCKLAKLCKNSVQKIKILHKQQFGERNENFPHPSKSINPYSLYMITNYSRWDKEKTLKNSRDLTHTSESYHQVKIDEANAMEQVWDEAIQFWNDILTIFLRDIGLENKKPQPKIEQFQLFKL